MTVPGPDRRTFLTLGIGALVVATVPSARRRPRSLVRRRIPVMGTVAEIAVPGPDGGAAQRAIDAALSELRRVESVMTRFRSDSDVGRINLASSHWHDVSMDTAEVLQRALRWTTATGGRFDACLGRASELWDASSRDTPPPQELLAEISARASVELEVERRHTGARARLSAPDQAIDLGGIAKGFAVDAAAEALRSHGYRDGLVNVGGDLRALGVDVSDQPWRIGIRSPESAEALADVLEVSDASVATSGDYVRYFEHGGRRYHHLLDPETRAPIRTATRSVTVRAHRCIDADAAATAFFGLGSLESLALQRVHPDVQLISRIQERAS
jgi:thiamine biosynthesis lipoprotein